MLSSPITTLMTLVAITKHCSHQSHNNSPQVFQNVHESTNRREQVVVDTDSIVELPLFVIQLHHQVISGIVQPIAVVLELDEPPLRLVELLQYHVVISHALLVLFLEKVRLPLKLALILILKIFLFQDGSIER